MTVLNYYFFFHFISSISERSRYKVTHRNIFFKFEINFMKSGKLLQHRNEKSHFLQLNYFYFKGFVFRTPFVRQISFEINIDVEPATKMTESCCRVEWDRSAKKKVGSLAIWGTVIYKQLFNDVIWQEDRKLNLKICEQIYLGTVHKLHRIFGPIPFPAFVHINPLIDG